MSLHNSATPRASNDAPRRLAIVYLRIPQPHLPTRYLSSLRTTLPLLTALALSLPVAAQPTPPLRLTPFTAGLNQPVDITHAPGDGRLFVVEREGRIRLVTAAGAVLPTPFLDITARVGSSSGEQGLLGLAFHPDYVTNGFFFVNYTDLNGDTHIARFQRQAGTADQADPASEALFFFASQPYDNHNGGALHFGPLDGYLYAALGDGGAGGDPQNLAQHLASPLGKVLSFGGDAGGPRRSSGT